MEDHHWGGQGWNTAVESEEKSGTGTGFCPSSLDFQCQYHSTMASHIHVGSGG
jgi:hypothetical protein